MWRIRQLSFVKQLLVVINEGREQGKRDAYQHAFVLGEVQELRVILAQVIPSLVSQWFNISPGALEAGAAGLAHRSNDIRGIAAGDHGPQGVIRIRAGVGYNVQDHTGIFLQLVVLVHPGLFQNYILRVGTRAEADEPSHLSGARIAAFAAGKSWRLDGGGRDSRGCCIGSRGCRIRNGRSCLRIGRGNRIGRSRRGAAGS